ncbi:radical SAM/SPASM domain-containing protein [Candidatus Omnitrophota bacterium]
MKNLYSRMKIFHYKDKVDSLPPWKDEILPPVHVRIKPTNVCNHSCWYCAYRLDGLQLGKDMVIKDFIPREKMEEIVDDIIDMGVKAVTFSGGGDPFCYPYLAETAKRLAESNVQFAALTNGSMLQGEAADVFAHHARWLRISVDGWDDASYMAYREVPDGEYTKIMKNIENFRKIGGDCFLGVCIIADEKNATHIYDMVKQYKKVGVNSIKIAPCIVSNSGKENNEYHEAIFDVVKKEIARAQEDLAAEGFEISDSYHTQLDSFKKDYKWCPYLQILPVIAADLNVYSCHDKAYNLEEGLLGAIKDESFKKFWFSDKNTFFKIDPSKHCNHHCVVDIQNRTLLDYLNIEEKHMDFV